MTRLSPVEKRVIPAEDNSFLTTNKYPEVSSETDGDGDAENVCKEKKKKSHSCSHTACFLTGKLNLLYIEVSVTTCDRGTLKTNAQCWLEESCLELCASSLSSRLPVSK